MSSPTRLVRRSKSGRIAGVCAGIAEYAGTDVIFIRLAWVVLSIVPGGFIGGAIAYAAAWILMPDSSEPVPVVEGARHLTRSVADRKIAGVCGGLAEYFRVDPTVARLLWALLTIYPGAVVLGIIAYLAAWLVMPSEPAPHIATASSPV